MGQRLWRIRIFHTFVIRIPTDYVFSERNHAIALIIVPEALYKNRVISTCLLLIVRSVMSVGVMHSW